MLTCPNKNLSEWKDLVAEHGEDLAMMAYVRNDGEIPSIEEANMLINPDYILDEVSDLEPMVYSTPVRTDVESSVRIKNLSEYKKVQNSADLNQATLEIMSNFETYFPDYAYLSEAQRQAMALNIASGKLNISCGL